MMTKTLYATSFYLLITGLTSVNGFATPNIIIQNSKFGENCMFVGNVAFGSPVTMSVVCFDCEFNLNMTYGNYNLGRHAKSQQIGIFLEI